MKEYHKSDFDGFYGLTVKADLCATWDDGSLGHGAAMTISRFQTEEGREYFIKYDKANDLAERLASENRYLLEQIQAIAKMPRPRRALRKLAGVNA